MDCTLNIYVVKEEDEGMEVKEEFEESENNEDEVVKVDSLQTELMIINDEDENIEVKEEVLDEEDPLRLPGKMLFHDV